MKRAKRLYILLGVLAVLSVAAIAVIQREEHKEKIKDSGETILQIPYEGVTVNIGWSMSYRHEPHLGILKKILSIHKLYHNDYHKQLLYHQNAYPTVISRKAIYFKSCIHPSFVTPVAHWLA